MVILVIVFGLLFLGWFGTKLTGIGQGAIKTRTLHIGLGYRLQGWPALSVGAVLILAGVVVFTPFVWAMSLLFIEIAKACVAVPVFRS
jgi:hypothetical protein